MIVRSPDALAQAMTYRNFTVRSLADAVGADRSTIGHLRSGRRTNCPDDLAERIAKSVAMPLDFLFVGASSNNSQEGGRL